MELNLQDSLRRVGYCVIPSAIPEDVLVNLRSQCGELPTLKLVRDGELRAEQVHRYVDLAGLLRSAPGLSNALAQLVGPSTILLTNRHNHFGVSTATQYRSSRMHRDALGWTRSYITLLIPVSGFDSSDAQLTLIPGSHLWPTVGPTNGGGYWLDEGPYASDFHQALKTSLAAGDVLAIDPLLFHSAGHGNPSATREMLSLAVHGGDELLSTPRENEVPLAGSLPTYRGQGWALEPEALS